MIDKIEPLSMAEVLEYLKKDKASDKEIAGFIKKFSKIKPEEAKQLKEKIRRLGLMKVKEEYIAKIIDLLPENAEELNKIFSDVGLNEDESNRILETIKEFK